TSSESRLRALTLDLLPAERARLHFLTQALAQEPPLAAQLPALARVEVVSPSILPEAPVSPRPLLNMAVAAVLAFFAATFFVFLREWWPNPAEDRPAERCTPSALLAHPTGAEQPAMPQGLGLGAFFTRAAHRCPPAGGRPRGEPWPSRCRRAPWPTRRSPWPRLRRRRGRPDPGCTPPRPAPRAR